MDSQVEVVADSAPKPAVFECGYYNVEDVHQIARSLLHTLATACVEKTVGDFFNEPASVYQDVKKELLQYLEVQGEQYKANHKIWSELVEARNPVKVIEELLDDFVQSKSSFFAKVSGVLLSDRKDDKVEDFMGDLDQAGAWIVGRRESFARQILGMVDVGFISHCNMAFETREELVEHKAKCPFRPVTCQNDGCAEVCSAFQLDVHDRSCHYKLIPCEQNCKAIVMRGEMDRHCVTACSMKLVSCPFVQTGCMAMLPQSAIKQHCVDAMGRHLFLLLQIVQKQEMMVEDQGQRLSLLDKAFMAVQQHGNTSDYQENKDGEHNNLYQNLKLEKIYEEVNRLREELENIRKDANIPNGHTNISNGHVGIHDSAPN